MSKQNIEKVLKKEGCLIYPIIGRSMFPLLKEGDQVLLEVKPSYKVNEIVLFKTEEKTKRYILHRIRKIENDLYYILGDNSLRLDVVKKDKILARMSGKYNGTELVRLNEGEVISYERKYISNPKISIETAINSLKTAVFSRFDEAVIEISKHLIDGAYEIDITKINCLTGEECDHLIEFLYSKKALHILADLLPKIETSISEDNIKLINDMNEIAKMRFIRIHKLENKIVEVFNLHKINFMFLKGSEIRSLYARQYYRTSNDIDIYVSPSSIEEAKQVLLDEFNAKILPSSAPHHLNLIVDEYKMEIELHFSLKYILPKELEYLFENPFSDGYVDAVNPYQYHMSHDRYYLYHVLHVAKHTINGELWLNMLSDTYLLNHLRPVDTTLLKEAGLDKFEQALLAVSNHLFNRTTLNENEFKLLRFIYLDNYMRYISLSKGKHSSKRSYIHSRIIVSRSYLIKQYPKLKDHPELLAYYQTKRWFRIFKKNKLKDSIYELNDYSVSSGEASEWIRLNGLDKFI